LKSLYLLNRRVLWPSFGHNVRAQQQPRTLGRSPLLARAKDQTFTAFPLTRLENQPPAYLSVGHQLLLSTSSNAQSPVRLNQTLPVKKLFEKLRTNFARSAMDQSRWWVRSREQGWVNSRERQGPRSWGLEWLINFSSSLSTFISLLRAPISSLRIFFRSLDDRQAL
jgi:hypothetical protein